MFSEMFQEYLFAKLEERRDMFADRNTSLFKKISNVSFYFLFTDIKGSNSKFYRYKSLNVTHR